MGVSTDAILAFGVALEEEVWPYDAEDDDAEGFPLEFEEYLARRAGLPDPYTELNYDPKDPAWIQRRDASFEARKKLVEDAPIEIVTHQHHEYPCYIIAIKGTVTTARRGYPERPAMITPSAEMWEKARAFCEENEIKCPGDPDWLLASWWG